ncbi:uncharacterized protein LOC143682722 isoform X2 [Tamandua tetradactyla]|uniref:uncharacterized protein LOC143682722 isoform X2 n=1 Tax=Tamandua tetradactyla TaxID=48850 RepID=UPI004054905A
MDKPEAKSQRKSHAGSKSRKSVEPEEQTQGAKNRHVTGGSDARPRKAQIAGNQHRNTAGFGLKSKLGFSFLLASKPVVLLSGSSTLGRWQDGYKNPKQHIHAWHCPEREKVTLT